MRGNARPVYVPVVRWSDESRSQTCGVETKVVGDGRQEERRKKSRSREPVVGNPCRKRVPAPTNHPSPATRLERR